MSPTYSKWQTVIFGTTPRKRWTSLSVHHGSIPSLAIEMVQIKHGQSCENVTDPFSQVTQELNSRKNWDCRIPSVSAVFHGSESTSYEIPKNWEIAPVNKNEFISLNNLELGTIKLPWEASQAIYKWRWFSSMKSSCIF